MRYLVTLTLLTALAGCGDDSTPSDSGPGADGATTDAPQTDTSSSDVGDSDAGPGDDGGGADSALDDAGVEDTGPEPEAEFRELAGLVVFEAENYYEQLNDEWTRWYEFSSDGPAPDVMCRTNVSCGGGGAPDCNQYSDCDGDDISPDDASGNTYLEALPDRRRDDSEPGTAGDIGVVNEAGRGPTLRYRVLFDNPGRYYVWVHARGQGPAANGLHVGIDDTWPRNDLVDPSTMRMQFGNGWRWTQTRRGGSQHTGVSGTDTVNVRDANIWLEVDAPGVHVIQFSMREDGLEIDKVILASDRDYVPEGLDQPETTP